MTEPDPQESEAVRSAVDRAVAWLVDHLDNCPRPIIPFVRQSFNIGNLDAIEAVKFAREKRGAGA